MTENKQQGLYDLNNDKNESKNGVQTTTADMEKEKSGTEAFEKKMRQTNLNLQTSGHERVDVEFLGIKKDIEHDHIYKPTFCKKEDFQKIRNDQLLEMLKRLKDNFGYGITEDRFNAFEHDLFHGDLQAKQKYYKHLGVSYQDQRAPHVAFSRRDKFSLQKSKVFEKGQKK